MAGGFFSGEKSQSPVRGRPNPEAKNMKKGPGPTDNDGDEGAGTPKKGSSQPKPPKAAGPAQHEGQPPPMEKKAPIGQAQKMKQVLMALALRQHQHEATPGPMAHPPMPQPPQAGPPVVPPGSGGPPPRPMAGPPTMGAQRASHAPTPPSHCRLLANVFPNAQQHDGLRTPRRAATGPRGGSTAGHSRSRRASLLRNGRRSSPNGRYAHGPNGRWPSRHWRCSGQPCPTRAAGWWRHAPGPNGPRHSTNASAAAGQRGVVNA